MTFNNICNMSNVTLDKIFFIINQGQMHWTCAVIYMKEYRIQLYDSMHGSGQHYLHDLFQYIQDEHIDKKSVHYQILINGN
jgi:Ulp1 family protease